MKNKCDLRKEWNAEKTDASETASLMDKRHFELSLRETNISSEAAAKIMLEA